MYKRMISKVLLTIIISAIMVPTIISMPSPDEPPIWDDDWAFRQEISLPINTNSKYTHYQPIDISIEFDDICWAKNENEHSLRVCFWDGNIWHQLESQIYNLNYTDDDHISSCSLVFIIPEEANGKERYYVHYDDDIKPSPNYPDHVDIDEDYYIYEQIPGLIFESDYYMIKESDNIVYAVNKQGKALGETVTQQVAKLIKGTSNVKPNAGEMGASFDFRYWWMRNGKWQGPITSSNRLIKNQIIIDGNLMVKLGIESESADGLLRSTVIYKYYYCPNEDKRIYVHAKYEVINYPLPTGDNVDVGYINLGYGSVKSNTVEELNFGKIYPYLHLYSEEGRIREYNVPQFPEGDKSQEVIGKDEECDLGSPPWVSVDEGETGKAHAVIFESTEVIKSEYLGKDGITLELWEGNQYNYPGLDTRLAFLYLLKDIDREDNEFENTLPKDFVVEFNAEFFTTENGGYPAVEEEAKIFQLLIQYQGTADDDITDDKENLERFNLTSYVHFARSFPFGLYISTAFGHSFSYLTAEIYKENTTINSGSQGVTRISLKEGVTSNLQDMTLLELLKLLDLKNFSLIKKVIFPKLEKGQYLIKIFRENSFIKEGRQFIGYTIVDVDSDKKTHIFYKDEGKFSLSFLNQDNIGIENVQIFLKKDNFIIANSTSDSDGNSIVKAPCSFREKYLLNLIYKGFLINEEQILFGRIRRLIPLKKTFSFDVHDLEIRVRDSDDKIPDFNVDLSLTSEEMYNPVSLKSDSRSNGVYKFNDLYPANYVLTINYNSFEIKKEIKIPDMNFFEIKLYDFTANIKDIWNLSPGAKLDVVLISEDFEKTVEISGDQLSPKKYFFTNLYPGSYILKARYKTYKIEELISIPNIEDIEIVFPALYNISLIIYDSHGFPLKDAKVLIIREEKDVQGITNNNGEMIFSLPPGSYKINIFSDGNLIAKRHIEIFNDIESKIVTIKEPLHPYIVIGLSAIAFSIFAVISYRKKDIIFFLKILAILLVLVSIVSPWWEINGSSSEPTLDTSTKLFLLPTKMITFTSNNNITSGEITTLEYNFVDIVDNVLPIVIAISFIFLISSLILDRYSMMDFSFMIFLVSIALYIGIIVIFISEMSKLTNLTVGSFIGSGNLEINIPGEKLFEIIFCNWGPSIGFLLFLCTIIILIFTLYLNYRKTIIKYLKSIKQLIK